MVASSESENIIRRLYQITNDYQKGFDIQISQLLMMGLERFNLDIGILSKIEGDTYTVMHCVTPEGVELNVGDTFEYKTTYCAITCGSFGPVAIENMGESIDYATHPAYAAFGLESYIGIPIFVDEEVVGTLNFSSAIPYPRTFEEIDIDALKLMASWIEVELIRRKQEQQLQDLNQQLEYQALYDPLTKIANRRCMFQTLNADVDRMKYGKGQGTLAVIDIDHFKKINDTHGHQIGDEIIQKVAEVLKSNIRESDFVARFGGEEFVVWLPEGSQPERHEVLNVANQCVNDILIDGKSVAVSIGACDFVFDKPVSEKSSYILDRLIAKADQAMYDAKQNGRNQLRTTSYCINTESETL